MFAKAILALALTTTALTTATTAHAGNLNAEARSAYSAEAKDKSGYMKSLYRGIYYHSDQEAWRQCVMRRESTYTYNVIGGGSDNYHGAYQFHDRDWRRGLTFMMAAESRKSGDNLREEARELINLPINKWSRYWQDRAFFTALNIRGKWSGKHHWHHPTKGC